MRRNVDVGTINALESTMSALKDSIATSDRKSVTFAGDGATSALKRGAECLFQLNSDYVMSSKTGEWAHLFDDDDDTESETLSDYEDEDDENIDHEEETRAVQALVKAAFSRTLSAPALNKLIGGEEPAKKKARVETAATSSVTMTPKFDRIRLIESAPTLVIMQSPTRQSSHNDKFPGTKPDEFLRSLLESRGFSSKTFAASSLDNFFETLSQESIDVYDMEVVKAVRQEDVETLRKRKQQGKTLQCGNKFGETILHIASRRCSTSVVSFLLDEAGVSPKVVCDYGRTVLHDAAWTSTPNFDVIDLLLKACPDLLHITDKRGFTPLAYVRAEHWGDWCRYLERKPIEQLVPRELC